MQNREDRSRSWDFVRRVAWALTLVHVIAVSHVYLDRVVVTGSLNPVVTISNVATLSVCNTSVSITYTTSSAAHAYVEYGLTTSYGSSTMDDSARFYTEHAAILSGLTGNTTYHYRVIASDGTGTVVGSDQTFITASTDDCLSVPTLIDTRMPDMSGAVERTVKATGGNYTPSQFQTALNDACAATGKRIITVDAGTILTGNFTLCNKVDSNWIILQSSGASTLAQGRRVQPNNAAALFKIVTSDTVAPLSTASGAHHWRIIGAEVTLTSGALADAPGGFSQNGLIRLGTASETSESQWPHHIILDRMYIHGLPLKNTTRGVYANGTDWAVIDSYLSEFHDTGKDSQAILAGQWRRAKIVNNYLEAAGENFLSGGVDHTVSPVTTPSDLEFTHNSVTKKSSWKSNDPSWDGKDWITKNHWESKSIKRVFVAFTVFDKWWSSEQTGGSINIKSSDDDKDPTVVSRDILWYRNWHRNLGSAIVLNGSFWADEESTDWTKHIWFVQNLFEVNGDVWDNEDSGNSSPADVAFIGMSVVSEGGGVFRKQYPDDLRLIHNTFTNGIASESARRMHLYDEIPTTNGKSEDFIVRDNIFGYGSNGIKTGGTSEGTASLNAATNSATRTWSTNLVAGSSSNYPSGNTYVANFTAVKFVSFNNGLDGDYRLASDSPGKAAASDGTDMGADFTALMSATSHTIGGNWTQPAAPTPTPTPTPTSTPTPSPTATPTPTPTPSPTPTPTPGPLPICKPSQLIGSPPVCRCTTKIIGPPSARRCRP